LDAYERALAFFEGGDAPADRAHCVLLHNSIAATLHRMGRHAAARQRLIESLAVARATGERLLEGHALTLLGDVQRAEGATGDARESYEASLSVRRAIGDHRGEGWVLQKLAALAFATKDRDRAELLRTDALRVAESCADAALRMACEEMQGTNNEE